MANSSAERGIAIGGIGVATLLGLGLFYVRFCGSASLPAPPPPPKVLQVDLDTVPAALQASTEVFAQRLAADSERWGVRPAATPESMGHVFAHRAIHQRVALEPGKRGTEINGLRLEAFTRGKTLGLRVENLTDHAVAYRVVTRPDRGQRECGRKESWPHNAMALAARGDRAAVVERSECGHRRGKGLVVTEVEVIALPPLAFHYLSRLEPSSVGNTAITANGHRLPPGPTCNRRISGVLDTAIRAGRTTWRDLVDFYARHSCLEYRFPSNYKAFDGPGQLALPAVPPG